MRPLVWISILFTFIDYCVLVKGISVTACSWRGYECSSFELNCTMQHIRIIGAEYRYNKLNECASDFSCLKSNICCVAANNDCRANFTDEHFTDLLQSCDGKHWCGPLQSPTTPLLGHIGRCNNYAYPGFIQLTYTCIPPGSTVQLLSTTKCSTCLSSGMTSTLSATNTSSGNELNVSEQENKGQTLSITLGVIGGALVIIIVAVVILLYKKRRKRETTSNGMMNVGYETCKQSNISLATVENSNYDIINDESIATYSHPVKKQNDAENNVEVATKYGGDGTTDTYDRIEFGRKCATKQQNYDDLLAMKGVIPGDTYAHASSQTKDVPTHNANNYSHCEFGRKHLIREDKLTKSIMNANLKDNDYSHVDLNVEWNKEKQPNIDEEDSYNHINVDRTVRLIENEKVAIERASSEPNANPVTFPDIKSQVESEIC